MMKRVITGVLSAAYVIAMVLLGRTAMLLNMGIVLLLGTYEMLDTLSSGGMKPIKWVYYVYAAALIPAYVFFAEKGLLIAVMVGMLVFMAMASVRTEPDAKQLLGALLPAFYPALPLMALVMLICNDGPFWRMLVWLTFALSVGSDVCALYAGKFFGKRKLIPQVSPNKTVEGAYGGIAGSVIAALVIYFITFFRGEGLNVWMFIGLGIVGSLVTQLGDITASYIKRFCSAKDFGKIFPGHGGLLDRLDGVMFSAVSMCIFMMITGF